MARCVILSACPVSPALAGLLREDDFIIACDAGYRNCAPLHCKPHVIVGDFDTAPCPQQEDDEIGSAPCQGRYRYGIRGKAGRAEGL